MLLGTLEFTIDPPYLIVFIVVLFYLPAFTPLKFLFYCRNTTCSAKSVHNFYTNVAQLPNLACGFAYSCGLGWVVWELVEDLFQDLFYTSIELEGGQVLMYKMSSSSYCIFVGL